MDRYWRIIKIKAKLDEQGRAMEERQRNSWSQGRSPPLYCSNQLRHNTMEGGGIDLPHPPLPFAHWGVVYMVRGQGDPTALIPCDFVLVGCGAVWGFTLLCLFPLSYFLHA